MNARPAAVPTPFARVHRAGTRRAAARALALLAAAGVAAGSAWAVPALAGAAPAPAAVDRPMPRVVRSVASGNADAAARPLARGFLGSARAGIDAPAPDGSADAPGAGTSAAARAGEGAGTAASSPSSSPARSSRSGSSPAHTPSGRTSATTRRGGAGADAGGALAARIAVTARGYQRELDRCQWVRMDLGASAPIVGAHNVCGGAVVLRLRDGDRVRISGQGLGGLYVVDGSRDAHPGDDSAAATRGLAADAILQTCYVGSGEVRLVALERLGP